MIVAGCDVGSLTAKAVIVKDGEICSSAVIRSKTMPSASADEVMALALANASLSMGDIDYTVGTGYGRESISFVQDTASEITCHARGAWWNRPETRMIIDIGGQDAKAIKIDQKGKVIRYIYNDKCASGTGRFLEVMAEALEVRLEDMGALSQESTEKLTISNQCVIFAETEVISLINDGKKACDVIKALHHAMANRVASLAKSIKVEEEVVMTGGVAKNSGVFQALAQGLDLSLKSLAGVDPQINGAIGAALLAQDKARE